MCRVTAAIKFAVLILICQVGAAVSKQCRKLDSALSELCGYDYTVDFQHESHFNSSLRALGTFTKHLGDCSKYSKLMLCSLYMPRCEEDIAGPYLPCKRVCDEYVKDCGKSLMDLGLEWTIGTCQLLPESDDPETTKGYLGRCFEPPNFKPTAGNADSFKCWNVVDLSCQGLGYNQTVVSVSNQKLYSEYLKKKIGNYTADKKCGELTRQSVCAEALLPCKDNKVQYLCRSTCNKFFDTCKSPFNYGKDICIDFPDGNTPSGICDQTHWPRYGNWPTPPSTLIPPPTATTTTITTTTTGPRVTMTTRKRDNSEEPTSGPGTSKPNSSSSLASESCSQHWLIIIGLLVAVIFILLAALFFLAFQLYRKRRTGRYVYENRLYMSGKTIEFDMR